MTAVLVVTGPPGVGKSTVLHEADVLLAEAGLSHATVVMEEIARFGPSSPEDPHNSRLMYRNLASLWRNYTATGAVDRLLVEKLVLERSDLEPLYEAVSTARVTIVRLRAPLLLIEERLRRREPCPEGELSAARWWAPRMEQWAIEDHVVENVTRPPREVAAEVLSVAGWLGGP